jgi:hypothetical protein
LIRSTVPTPVCSSLANATNAFLFRQRRLDGLILEGVAIRELRPAEFRSLRYQWIKAP